MARHKVLAKRSGQKLSLLKKTSIYKTDIAKPEGAANQGDVLREQKAKSAALIEY